MECENLHLQVPMAARSFAGKKGSRLVVVVVVVVVIVVVRVVVVVLLFVAIFIVVAVSGVRVAARWWSRRAHMCIVMS